MPSPRPCEGVQPALRTRSRPGLARRPRGAPISHQASRRRRERASRSSRPGRGARAFATRDPMRRAPTRPLPPCSRGSPPLAADEASRAVVFTASPTAVKSHASPSPTRPTYATPVWTPAPIGIHGSGRRFRSLAELAGGVDRAVGVVLAREARHEQRDHLVADELVDDPVPLVDDPRRGAVEARDELRELVRRHPLGQSRRPANVREAGATARSPRLRASCRRSGSRRDRVGG